MLTAAYVSKFDLLTSNEFNIYSHTNYIQGLLNGKRDCMLRDVTTGRHLHAKKYSPS